MFCEHSSAPLRVLDGSTVRTNTAIDILRLVSSTMLSIERQAISIIALGDHCYPGRIITTFVESSTLEIGKEKPMF